MAEDLTLHAPLKEWVSHNASANFKEVLHLTNEESKKDPPEQPFRSLYAARELLKTLKRKLESCPAALKEHEDFLVLLTCLQLELGLNYINAEELSTGEDLLEACLTLLDGLPSKVKTASVSLQALNHLGILWGNRDEQQKALECLLKAKAVYESHVALPPPITDSQWLTGDSGADPPSEEERERAFEGNHTLTLFYLAQVYGNLKQAKLSAQYCQSTLSRQLETGDYDAVEWSLNCATLSQYYVAQENFAQSRHCLAAASFVLQQFRAEQCSPSVSATTGEELPAEADVRMVERLRQTEADISRCWTKYCISLLTSSQQQQQQHQVGSNSSENSGGSGVGGGGGGRSRNKQFRFDGLSLGENESSVPCDLAVDYESAKPVFLACQKHVASSKEHYTLEEHASEHVLVIQDHSNAFKLLAHFEGSPELKCRMHKRRVDMLASLRGELSPQYYLAEHRQLMHEVAEALAEMAGLKIVLASDSPTVHAITKINKLLWSAIRMFEQFVATFHEGSGDGALPEKIDVDYLRPILCSKLNVARLYSKLIAPDPPTQKSHLETSLEQYKWLVDYCERHKEEADEVFETELALSKEMVQLLPHRIATF